MIEVGAAQPGEAAALAELAARTLVDPWSEGAFAEEFRIAAATVLVAREGPRLVGYVAARKLPDELEVLSLAVAPEQRRRGLGRRLLEALGRACPGPDRVVLEVRVGNAGARAFYARLGFRVVGRRPRYYPDGDDALLLSGCLPLRPPSGHL